MFPSQGVINMFETVVIIAMLLILWNWLMCMISVLKNDFEGNNKIIWLLVLIFVPVIGNMLYMFIGQAQIRGSNLKDYKMNFNERFEKTNTNISHEL